ncbi:hypothetical protein GQR58_022643 [Nymphon striatum]|nr:hypothetical protein GQR58_022643 [Nymphon striatum]
MCPVCTNVWVRDLGNYRYPVEKIGKCPTQYGKEDPRFNMNVILCAVSILILYSSVDSVSIESQTTVPENDDPVEVTTVPTKEEELVINACKDVVCGLGQQCKINKDGIGQCLCIEQCQEETDERRKHYFSKTSNVLTCEAKSVSKVEALATVSKTFEGQQKIDIVFDGKP